MKLGSRPITKLNRVFYGWIIVVVAVLIGFLTTGLFGYANGILLPSYTESLGDGSRGKVAIAFSIATFVSAFISPMIGKWADQNSPKAVLLLGGSLITVAYVIIANAPNIWVFYFGQGLIFGLGISMAGPVIRSLIVARWFDRWRGRALGISVLGASLAGVALPLFLNAAVEGLGWRQTVWIFAAVTVFILLPAIWFFVKDKPSELDEVMDGKNNIDKLPPVVKMQTVDDTRIWSWSDLARSKAFWAAGLIFGPMTCVYIAISVHLFGHATSSGLTNPQAAMVLSTMALSSVIGKPLMGMIADAAGSRITVWASLLLQGGAMVLFTQSSEFWHFLFAATLHGAGYAAFSAMRTFVLSTSIGMASLGTSVGLLRWVELPFGVLASPLAGFVYDATKSYDIAFLTFAALLFIGCIGPFFIADSRPKKLVASEPSTSKA